MNIETKICSKCNVEKSLTEFYKDKSKNDDFRSACKICDEIIKQKYKLSHKNEKANYDKKRRKKLKKKLKINHHEYYCKHQKEIKKYNKNRYKKVIWKYIFYGIYNRCNNPKNKFYYRYGGREIECRITEDEIKQLMKRDHYWDLKKPSIDRIDNDGNYELSNCRFIELSENIARKNRKQISQFNLDGMLIKSYGSAKEASENTNFDYNYIADCAKAIKETNYIWRYR